MYWWYQTKLAIKWIAQSHDHLKSDNNISRHYIREKLIQLTFLVFDDTVEISNSVTDFERSASMASPIIYRKYQ